MLDSAYAVGVVEKRHTREGEWDMMLNMSDAAAYHERLRAAADHERLVRVARQNRQARPRFSLPRWRLSIGLERTNRLVGRPQTGYAVETTTVTTGTTR